MSTKTTTIGWIGLGKMGIPMSQQLVKAGYPLTVYNRNRDKEDTLRSLGAATASSPQLLMQSAEIIFVMVSDDQAVRDIFLGDKGLLAPASSSSASWPSSAPEVSSAPSPSSAPEVSAGSPTSQSSSAPSPSSAPGVSAGSPAPGRIIINMSTVSPSISRDMAGACQQQGHHYIDAPVSGSVKQAEDGQLVIMAGGDEDVVEKARPVLEKIGRLTLRVGGSGAGNTAKLVINTLLGIYAQGLAEAVVFARNNGIKTEDLITLINNSALGNVFIKIKGDAIIHDQYKAAFALKHIVKDLGLAKEIGLDMPLGNVAHDSFLAAAPELGEEDIIAIIKKL